MGKQTVHNTFGHKSLPLHRVVGSTQYIKGNKLTPSMAKDVPKDYLHDGALRLRYSLSKLDDLPEPNRTYSVDYERFLELKNRKERTRARRIYEVRYCLQKLGKDAKKATKRDIEDLVLGINKARMAESSKSVTKITLKNFYKWLYNVPGKRAYPELVDWIEIKSYNSSTKNPEDMLNMQEIESLIGACKSPRDRAVIAILSTFGCRVGELLNLKFKDVVMSDKEVSWILFDGKTGVRRCPYTNNSLCFPYLVEYLNGYKPKNKDAPLFVTKDGLAFDYKNIRKLLSNLQKRTGLKKRLHPHLFRYSVSTGLAGVLTEQHLKRYMGWTADSRMAAVYVKMKDTDLASSIMKVTGVRNEMAVEEEKPKLTVKHCKKCKETNPITNICCFRCGSNLDVDAIKEMDDIERLKRDVEDMKRENKDLRELVKLALHQGNSSR